jgi:membrane-bound lytic murein transglycosylase B
MFLHFRRRFILYFALFALLMSYWPYGSLGFPHAFAQADPCTTNTSGKTKAELQADLDACTADIAKWTNVLNSTKQNTVSYATEVKALTAKINQAESSIKAKNIAIASLGKDISQKQTKINALEDKIDSGHASLALLLRKTNEIDGYSLADAMLSKQDLSEFFSDADAYLSTQKSLQVVTDELKGAKSSTEEEKAALDKQRQEAADAKAAIEDAKARVQASQKEQKALLTVSQNQEKVFGQVVADKQAKAAQIRAALFPLRDAGAIQFGQALTYAEEASAVTGIRPAFVLGILQQESNLGANVGSCIITNLLSGETKNVNSGRVYAKGIHPTRDLPILQTLLTGLGRDPLTTKVSCPLSIGYGGGMGPAQFIPSTWNIMKGKVANALGKPVADPWNPEDAIMASALFLKDLGASAGTYSSERTAACRYYGGGSACTRTTSAYGDQVMAKAASIQTTMIDPLQGV